MPLVRLLKLSHAHEAVGPVGVFRGAVACIVLWGMAGAGFAQAPGVEIVRDKGAYFKDLVEQGNALREAGALLALDDVARQLDRKTCDIELPEPGTTELTDREIWRRSKAAHLRVGWHHLCDKSDHWHENLAGGYFVNTNGVVATCHHVIAKDGNAYREAYLVAATDDGKLLPVLEVLASDEATDTALIRVKVEGEITALPLNANVYPGDSAWCYSDPLGRSGYFSKGIVNRFYYHREKGHKETPRMEVSTDWAPGSSGAAVLDAYGNAIGHVSEVSAAGTRAKRPVVSKDEAVTNHVLHVAAESPKPVIVFHCAARAADVLNLVRTPQADTTEPATADTGR